MKCINRIGYKMFIFFVLKCGLGSSFRIFLMGCLRSDFYNENYDFKNKIFIREIERK